MVTQPALYVHDFITFKRTAFPHHNLVTFYIELRIMAHSEGLEPPAQFHGFAHESALPTELTMQ